MSVPHVSKVCLCLLASVFDLQAAIINPSFEDGVPAGGESVPFLSTTAPTGWTIWNRLDNTDWINTTSPDWVSGTRSSIPIAADGDYFVALDSYYRPADGESDPVYVEAGIRSTMTDLTIGETYQVTIDASAIGIPTPMYTISGFLDAYVGAAGSSSLNLAQSFFITDAVVFDPSFAVTSFSNGTYSFSFLATAETMELGLRSRIADPQGANSEKIFSLAVDNLHLVPEPSSALLAACGCIFGVTRRRRAR